MVSIMVRDQQGFAENALTCAMWKPGVEICFGIFDQASAWPCRSFLNEQRFWSTRQLWVAFLFSASSLPAMPETRVWGSC